MKNFKFIMFLCLWGSLPLLGAAVRITFDQALEANKVLNSLVDDLHGDPKNFPNKEINKFVRNYELFKQYVEQLQSEGKSEDAAYYQQYFLKPYQIFYDQIVKYAEKNPTELQKQLHILEDQTQQIQDILDQVNQQISAAFGQFTDTMKDKIGSISDYNESKKELFFASLQGAVKTFEASMTSLELEARNMFFSKNQNIDPNQPTPTQIRFLTSVRKLVQNALIQVHALVLDLTSEHLNLDFASQTAAALARYEKAAEDNYKRSLEENKSGADKAWFDDVKAKGSRFIDSFKKEFTKQATAKLKEVKDQAVAQLKERATATAKKFGGELLDNVKKKLA